MKVLKDAPAFDPKKPSKKYSEVIDAPPFDPEAKSQEYSGATAEAMKTPSMLESGLKTLGAVSDVLDIGGAPARTAIKALQEGESPLKAVGEFGEKLVTEGRQAFREAPTGKEIASGMGLSEEPIGGYVPLLKDVSPAGAAGVVVEAVADPLQFLVPAKKVAQPLIKYAQKRGRQQTARALRKWINQTKISKEGFNPEVLGAQLFEQDLTKLLKNPRKLGEKLGGETDLVEIVEGGTTTFAPSKKSSGMIGQLSSEVDDVVFIAQDAMKGGKIPKKELREAVIKDVQKDIVSALGGEPYDEASLKSIRKYVDGFLVKDKYSLPELHQLKKNINKTTKTREFMKGADDAQAIKNEVKVSMSRKLRDIVEEAIDQAPIDSRNLPEGVNSAANLYSAKNKQISHLLKLKELAETGAIQEFKSGEDLYQFIMGSGARVAGGMGLGAMAGSPFIGAGAMGVYEAARESGKFAKDVAPAFMANRFKGLEKKAPYVIRSLPQIQRELRGEAVRREPQSVAEQIETTPLSRNTQELMSQPQLFLGKIAQQKPQAFDLAKEAMRQGGMYLDNFIKQMVIESPHLFEQDKYNRIDGKITDPASRATAIKDVNNMGDLNSVEKAEIIDKLNKTGEFPL